MITNRIIQGDNAEVLKTFPDGCIDLTVTSPPYDAMDDSWRIIDQQRQYKAYQWDFPTLAKELFRVTKMGGVLVWVVGDYMIDGYDGAKTESGTPLRQGLHFMQCGFNLDDTIPYIKDPRYPEKVRYPQAWEYIFVFTKGKPKTFNQIKDYKTKSWLKWRHNHAGNRQANGEVKYRPFTVNQYGARCNVWYYDVGNGRTTTDEVAFDHPAIFPDALAEDCIKSWSNEGDLVLDPFAGSGTTLKMAASLQRQWIGIEIAGEYIEIANKRLAPLLAQERLL